MIRAEARDRNLNIDRSLVLDLASLGLMRDLFFYALTRQGLITSSLGDSGNARVRAD